MAICQKSKAFSFIEKEFWFAHTKLVQKALQIQYH